MAHPSKARRGRSRKRRPAAERIAAAPAGTPAPSTAERPTRSQQRNRSAPATPPPASSTYGERPAPPWHPVPASELLILVGAIATVIGVTRGASFGNAPLLAGIAAVVLGTVEFTLREHRSGYRSHAMLLAAIPVLAFHTVVGLTVRMPRSLNVALLAVDAGLFYLLFRLLRRSFLDARTRAVSRR